MKRAEIKVPKDVMQNYLSSIIKKPVNIINYERLGSGWHGTGYRIVYRLDGEENTVILRTLRPDGFSHEYPADRARVFVHQHLHSRELEGHVKSIDVGGFSEQGSLTSIGNCNEFFQLVEVAHGSEYINDLEAIKKRKTLTGTDTKRIQILAKYMADLHKQKLDPSQFGDEGESVAKSMYLRHTRDCIGQGEMLYGVLDTYPESAGWTSDEEFAKIIYEASLFRQKIRHKHHRLAKMHGDIHQFNIIFSEDDALKVLDSSRFIWGDPADDVTCLTMNFICFALEQTGTFKGPFQELFELFWKEYLQLTGDEEILESAPLFFAFRGAVVAHPVFYPDLTELVRRKIFGFIHNVLNDDKFHLDKIEDYLEVK